MTEDAPTHAVEQIEQWSGKIQNLLKMLTGRLKVLRPFVVLDRDGTIIEERRYLANPSTITLVPGAVEGLRRMSELGLGLVIVTNQSAVGRGYISRLQLDLIHQRLFCGWRQSQRHRIGKTDRRHHFSRRHWLRA